MDIDFVITWVDGNDPEWQKEKEKYEGKASGDSRNKRYREWGLLPYWFRAIEKYAPWVRYIHFVTCGHVPSWLNTDNPKLRIVKHADFIPAEYLPTFSCRPIELNIHRIPELSEHFVYFNDDMFLTDKVSPEDFFLNGLPCDTAILDAAYIDGGKVGGKKLQIMEYNTSPVMNMVPLNRNFAKKEVISKNKSKWYCLKYGPQMARNILLKPWKYFTGIKSFHLPYSYLKSTFEDVWEKEPDLLKVACSHKFRNSMDVSSRLFSYWQLAKGTFSPRSPKTGKMFYITGEEENDQRIYDAIRGKTYKTICINDEYEGDSFTITQQKIISVFEESLTVKSAYER